MSSWATGRTSWPSCLSWSFPPTTPARVQTHRGARRSLTLPESLTQALKELSRQEGTTLFMVLLGAFQVLLSRYSGKKT